MMRLAALLMAILGGCAAPVQVCVPDADLLTADLALEVWAGPVTERCAIEAPLVSELRAAQDEVERLCAGNQVGCFIPSARMYGVPEARPWIVIVEDLPDATTLAEVRAHELAHWAKACSGEGRGDADHGRESFEDVIEGLLTAAAL